MLHHTMKADMDHATYIHMAAPIRETHAYLMDDKTMAEEIDRTLVACLRSRLPVYVYVPADAVAVELDATRLETPLDINVHNKDTKTEDQIVNSVLSLIEKASHPVILGDVLAVRHGGRDLTRKLADLTQFPSYCTPLSKGVFDETLSYFSGLYNGKGKFRPDEIKILTDTLTVSFPGVAHSIEASDLVLSIGPLPSDSNTGGFTREITDEHLVWLGHDFCKVQDQIFDDVHFLPILKKLVAALEAEPQKYNLPREQKKPRVEAPVLNDAKSGQIKQSYVWQRLGKFLRENDIFLVESGTAQFGMSDATFPPNIKYVTQTFWSSIGFTVGACLGALVAAKEMKHTGRVVLIVGEGSLQMTVQEIGTYIRYGLKPIIFVINNNGYAIERAIHGPEQEYNDVSMMWDHQKMLEFFGARQELGIKTKSRATKTVEELEAVLNDEDFASGDNYQVRLAAVVYLWSKLTSLQLCEIYMDTFDYPWRLSEQISVTREKMKRAAAQQTAAVGEA